MTSLANRRGSDLERYTARTLSLWLSEGKEDGWFWRSAMSGGRATLFGQVAATQAGDLSGLSAEAHRFLDKFVVECKRRRTLNLDRAVVGKSSQLEKLFGEAQHEAEKYGRQTWFVAKQDRLPTMLCLSHDVTIKIDHIIGFPIHSCLFSSSYDFAVFNYEDFLETVKPSNLLR